MRDGGRRRQMREWEGEKGIGIRGEGQRVREGERSDGGKREEE